MDCRFNGNLISALYTCGHMLFTKQSQMTVCRYYCFNSFIQIQLVSHSFPINGRMTSLDECMIRPGYYWRVFGINQRKSYHFSFETQSNKSSTTIRNTFETVLICHVLLSTLQINPQMTMCRTAKKINKQFEVQNISIRNILNLHR